MKFRTKWEVIVLNELKTQYKLFIVFFLIMFILLTSSVSINTLGFSLKNKFDEYIDELGLNFIGAHIDATSKEETIYSTDSKIVNEYAYIYGNVLGFTDEEEMEYNDKDMSTQGWAVKYIPNQENDIIKWVNEGNLEGEMIDEDSNNQCLMWMSDYFADVLNLKCGDNYQLKNEDAAVNVTVAGIYAYDDFGWAFVVSEDVYNSIYTTDGEWNVELYPNHIIKYFNVISNLKENFIMYDAMEDSMKSIALIIYGVEIIDIIVLLLNISFCVALIKMYYICRKEFFMILKTQGLTNKGIMKMIISIMSILYGVSFAFALVGAPLINKYIVSYINLLFDGFNMKVTYFCSNSIVLFLVGWGLVIASCVIQGKVFISDGISESLNKGNE